MWGSVQTVRGCPKHCSFCSVWRTDGQKPRQRGVDVVVGEIVELRRRGFRFVALADDNFYPVTLADLAMAERQRNIAAARTAAGAAGRAIRADGAAGASCRRTWCSSRRSRWRPPRTRRSSTRCGARNIKGALVGVEAVTPEGLKDVYKGFNDVGRGAGAASAEVPRARRARPRLVHLRAAERPPVDVRGDGRRRRARRPDLRAVRDADAVSRHRRLRGVGEEARRGRRRRSPAFRSRATG